MLPDFLKAVRETRGHTIQQTHLLTDYYTKDCESYENGKERIPKNYLRCFVVPYKIPKKLIHLGYDPEENRKNILATRIKNLRIENEIPQIIFAHEIDVARATYAAYESGRNEPDLKTLIKIADYYHVSLDYLAGRTN